MRIFAACVCMFGLSASTAYAIEAPSDLTAQLDSIDNSVNLSWSGITDASGYNIYRDDTYIDTVIAPETSYNDTVVGAEYYLTAFDSTVEPTAFSSRSSKVVLSVGNAGCGALPSHAALTNALKSSVLPTGGPTNGGFDLNMWAAVVNRDGEVCVITHSGATRGDQWPGSRVIAAQKANTANAFSLPGLALSTANLWAATQPGGSLFGLQFSNPVDPGVAYGSASDEPGSAAEYGTPNDPMVRNFIGGVNVFGGGLALYDSSGVLLGAIGVSGDTSCADHNIAWRTRADLQLDYVPGGVGAAGRPDNINYQGDATNTDLQNEFSHPVCTVAGSDGVSAISASLPVIRTGF